MFNSPSPFLIANGKEWAGKCAVTTPPLVGPCFRLNLISWRPKPQQNQTGLPNHNLKPTPAWLGGGGAAISRYNEKRTIQAHFFANLLLDGAYNTGKTERRDSRCLFAL